MTPSMRDHHTDMYEANSTRETHNAHEAGKVMATAMQCAGEMAGWAESYPRLFSAKPINATLFHAVACGNAFGSPWRSAEELRLVNRVSLWFSGLDWLVDHLATSKAEVDDIARRCLTVAEGGRPAADDELALFLAEIRQELAQSPTFEALHDEWAAQLRRTTDAMALEWDWKITRSPGDLPTLDRYLDVSHNYGAAWINLSHWIACGDPVVVHRLIELRTASHAVQRVLRLLNDLATYDRDLAWGDFNALMLGMDRSELSDRITEMTQDCHDLIEPLRPHCPEHATYLARQIGFNTGFYDSGDYWGSL
ncbi:terpene synthase family protein [Actinomadura rudentiformis]|uniref:Terpene synthase n=1 Tax=Actinomadura rudentiformis TaxID=359158 RepID=A0A6H9Z1Q4_9ACTN|nr:terpene synthase family protein [Actinomadura rudentiformis]KAB2350713.1 terpene synthase [Actinomadura rudentiformis]